MGEGFVLEGDGSWFWAAGAVALLVFILLLVRNTTYRLSRHEFEVMIGGFVVRRVPLSNIERVYVGRTFPSEIWLSRWSFSGRWLTVRRKRGLLRNLTISPPDPEKLRTNLYYTLGWKP